MIHVGSSSFKFIEFMFTLTILGAPADTKNTKLVQYTWLGHTLRSWHSGDQDRIVSSKPSWAT